MIADKAHMAFGMETPVVVGDDTCRFLPAVLESMQAKRGQRGGVLVAKNAEHAAFFMQMIIVFGDESAKSICHKLKLR
jgi:hypothetical protein